jgi:hypothetical protein
MMVAIELALLMILFYLVLEVIGISFVSVVEASFGVRNPTAIPAALIGISLTLWILFYSLWIGSRGIAGFSWPLTAFVLIAGLIFSRKQKKGLVRRVLCSFKENSLTIVLTSSIFVWSWRHLLINNGLTIGSENNDVIIYAQFARFLESNNFSDPGRMPAIHSGLWAESPIPGPMILIAFLKNLTSLNIEQTLLPVLGCSVIVMAVCIRQLITFFNISGIVGSAISAFAATTPLMIYLSGCYFLPQILTVSSITAFAMICIRISDLETKDLKAKAVDLFLLSMVASMVLATYPQYVVILPIFAVFITFRFTRLRSSILTSLYFCIAVAFAHALYAPLAARAIKRLIQLSKDANSGWPMHVVSPSQLFGFEWEPNVNTSSLDWHLSTMILGVFLFSYVANKSKGHFPLFRIVLFALFSYGLIVLRTGESYQQFKWISTLSPLFVASVLVAVMIQVRTVVSQKVLGLVIPVLILSLLTARNFISFEGWIKAPNKNRIPSQDMIELGSNPKILMTPELNIKTGPFSESMWPALFIEDSKVNVLDTSYYPLVPPLYAPTIVKKGFDLDRGVRASKLNNSYLLVNFPATENSMVAIGLNARVYAPSQITITRGAQFELRVVVENTGTSSWLGSGDFLGAVNIGLKVLQPESREVDYELPRAFLGLFPNYVPPGARRLVVVPLSFDSTGTYVIQIEPISEGLVWFSDVNQESASIIEIKVID